MKRKIGIAIFALVLLAVLTSLAVAGGPLYSQYDLYRDGVIDQTDMAMIRVMVYNFDPALMAIADFNDDGIIDVDDAMELGLRYGCRISDPCYW